MVPAVNKLKFLFFPKERYIYVVLEGKYKGEWLVVVKKDDKETTYFSLPDKHIRKIPNKDVEWGLNNKVLEPVDVLPKRVYNVCIAEYNYTATNVNKTFNRREQHSSPGSLDRE